MHRKGHLSQCPAPSGIPILRKKYFKEDKKSNLDSQKQRKWKIVTRGEKAQVTDSELKRKGKTKKIKEKLSQRYRLKDTLKRDCTAPSPRGYASSQSIVMSDERMSNSNICHRPTCAAEQSVQPLIEAKDKSRTMDSIFHDIFADGSLYCPWSLVQAVAGVTQKKMTLKRAATLYCVSPSRLQMCLSCLSILKDGKCEQYNRLLKKMRRYSTCEAVREWLLRMRRMGRCPVSADVKQVCRFIGELQQIRDTGHFIKLYGEETLPQEEWAVLSPSAATQWHSHFKDHISVYGMNPYKFLTSKNSSQVFTCAEVLLGLGDLSHEIIVARGRSNLYCLTQQDQGVARAILTFSAVGQFLSPTIIQKGYNIPQWALSEDSVDLIASPDGRWDPLVFLSWLRIFEQSLTRNGVPRPVILFVHGHPAHTSPAADAFCSAKRIILHSHHHSPINPMDPFIHLLPSLLYHLARTQEQLTALTSIHPLPDHLLPSILADAWTQVSKEKLAGLVFQKSGLVPLTDPECFSVAKYSKLSYFPPLLLLPFKAYLAADESPAELPYYPEPQLHTVYYLHSTKLHQKVPILDKADITQEEPACHGEANERDIVDENISQTCKQYCVAPELHQEVSVVDKVKITQEKPTCHKQMDKKDISDENFCQTDESHCVAPETICNSSMVESGEVVLMESDSISNYSGSLADNLSDNSAQEELDDLLLNCEIQEHLSLSKTILRSPDNQKRSTSCAKWEDKKGCNSLSEACDPLYVGPNTVSDLSIVESDRVIHIHNNVMASMRSSINNREKSHEEHDSSVTCEIQVHGSWPDSTLNSLQTEYLAFDNIHTSLLEDSSLNYQSHNIDHPNLTSNFTNIKLPKNQIKNEETTSARYDKDLL